MAEGQTGHSLPLRIVASFLLNAGVVYTLGWLFPQLFLLSPGWRALLIVSVIFTAMNVVVTPVLRILSLPIRAFVWTIGALLTNGLALWVTVRLVAVLKLEGVTLAIGGGLVTWLLLTIIFGLANGVLRRMLSRAKES